MKLWPLVALAGLFACGAAGLFSDDEPPARFRSNVRMVVETVDDPNSVCTPIVGQPPPEGMIYVGCYQNGVAYLPNPWLVSDRAFASIYRHEAGHANGWTEMHER